MKPNKPYHAAQPPQMLLFERPGMKIAVVKKAKKTDRVNRGRATNDLIHSAYQAPNDVVFPSILELYVSRGAKIADVTYGKGVFWRRVDKSKYHLHASDWRSEGIPNECKPGIDSRRLPYEDNSFDCVVFDPPYMHTPGGTAHNGHQNFEGYYANNAEQDRETASELAEKTGQVLPKYHEAVLDLYFRSGREAWRVLRGGGIFIVKCQDEVCTNRQRLTHIEITNEYERYGFMVEDLFVVVRNSKPGVSRIMTRQYHARKNHSYFMIYRKPREKEGKKRLRRGEV
jgi:hypothetical protein